MSDFERLSALEMSMLLDHQPLDQPPPCQLPAVAQNGTRVRCTVYVIPYLVLTRFTKDKAVNIYDHVEYAVMGTICSRAFRGHWSMDWMTEGDILEALRGEVGMLDTA